MSLNINSNYSSLLNKKNNMANLTTTVLGGSGNNLLDASDMSSLTKTVLGNSNGSSLLSDYAAIKDGSYGKLLKAYYAEKAAQEATANSEASSQKEETDNSKDTDTTATDTASLFSNVIDTYI